MNKIPLRSFIRSLTLLLLVCLCLPSMIQAEGIQQQKNIVIYLDESATIVSRSPDRLSIPLSDMLIKLLESKNFLNDYDKISIIRFGPYNVSEIEQNNSKTMEIQASDRKVWMQTLLDYRKEQDAPAVVFRNGKPVLNTLLDQVFYHMEDKFCDKSSTDEADDQTSSDKDLINIYILASDFVHDVHNTIRIGDSNSCNNELVKAVKDSIDSFKTLCGSSFTGEKPKSFFIGLRATKPPYDPSKSWYNANIRCWKQMGNDNSGYLVSSLDAMIEEFDEKLDVNKIVNNIIRKTTLPLQIGGEAYVVDKDGKNILHLNVKNPNSRPVMIDRMYVKFKDYSEPHKTDLKKQVKDKDKNNTIEIDDKELLSKLENTNADDVVITLNQSPQSIKGNQRTSVSIKKSQVVIKKTLLQLLQSGLSIDNPDNLMRIKTTLSLANYKKEASGTQKSITKKIKVELKDTDYNVITSKTKNTIFKDGKATTSIVFPKKNLRNTIRKGYIISAGDADSFDAGGKTTVQQETSFIQYFAHRIFWFIIPLIFTAISFFMLFLVWNNKSHKFTRDVRFLCFIIQIVSLVFVLAISHTIDITGTNYTQMMFIWIFSTLITGGFVSSLYVGGFRRSTARYIEDDNKKIGVDVFLRNYLLIRIVPILSVSVIIGIFLFMYYWIYA